MTRKYLSVLKTNPANYEALCKIYDERKRFCEKWLEREFCEASNIATSLQAPEGTGTRKLAEQMLADYEAGCLHVSDEIV